MIDITSTATYITYNDSGQIINTGLFSFNNRGELIFHQDNNIVISYNHSLDKPSRLIMKRTDYKINEYYYDIDTKGINNQPTIIRYTSENVPTNKGDCFKDIYTFDSNCNLIRHENEFCCNKFEVNSSNQIISKLNVNDEIETRFYYDDEKLVLSENTLQYCDSKQDFIKYEYNNDNLYKVVKYNKERKTESTTYLYWHIQKGIDSPNLNSLLIHNECIPKFN